MHHIYLRYMVLTCISRNWKMFLPSECRTSLGPTKNYLDLTFYKLVRTDWFAQSSNKSFLHFKESLKRTFINGLNCASLHCLMVNMRYQLPYSVLGLNSNKLFSYRKESYVLCFYIHTNIHIKK